MPSTPPSALRQLPLEELESQLAAERAALEELRPGASREDEDEDEEAAPSIMELWGAMAPKAVALVEELVTEGGS